MKLYDNKEVRAILKIAAENSSTDELNDQTGLSIDELRQIASEVGIDPNQVTKAAAEIEVNSTRNKRSFWGGPFSYNNQVLVEGEITVGQWEEMLHTIRDFFQSKGKVTTRDSVWEWSSPWDTTNSAQVTALKDNGKTNISVSWNGPMTAIPYYIPVPLVGIASVFFASEFLELTAVPGVGFTLMVTGLAFLVGRWALCRHLDIGMKKLHQMVASLDLIASRKKHQSELNVKPTNEREDQSETDNSMKNILKEENYNEPDIKMTRDYRSKI